MRIIQNLTVKWKWLTTVWNHICVVLLQISLNRGLIGSLGVDIGLTPYITQLLAKPLLRQPPVLTRWVRGETHVEAEHKELMDIDEALRQLRACLFRAYDQMKSQADTIRLDKSFEIGKWVIVKLCAHRQQSIVTHIHAKLDARYYGPYLIVAHVGTVAYKLKLLEGSRVHPSSNFMFHC